LRNWKKASQSKLLRLFASESKKRLKQQLGAFRLGGEENHNDPFEAFFGLTGTPFARDIPVDKYWRQQAAKNYTAGSTMWHGHVLSVSLPAIPKKVV